jgi:hypothetical protein
MNQKVLDDLSYLTEREKAIVFARAKKEGTEVILTKKEMEKIERKKEKELIKGKENAEKKRYTKKQQFLFKHGFDIEANEPKFKFDKGGETMTIIISQLSEAEFLRIADLYFVKKGVVPLAPL